MAKQFTKLEAEHREFIRRQHIFFTATSCATGRVNVSPRSTEAFRAVSDNAVLYLDRTGSGNETAAHLRADGRMTVMFCAITGLPMILRLYGRGRVIRRKSVECQKLLQQWFDAIEPIGTRQIVLLDVELVQTSCGYGVPLFDYKGERDTLDRWAAAKGLEGVEAYQRQKNRVSIDGFATGLFDEDQAV